MAPYSPKPQHYWNLTIRLFSVISRKLIARGLPLCRGAVSVFYSPSWLNNLLLHWLSFKGWRAQTALLFNHSWMHTFFKGFSTIWNANSFIEGLNSDCDVYFLQWFKEYLQPTNTIDYISVWIYWPLGEKENCIMITWKWGGISYIWNKVVFFLRVWKTTAATNFDK